MTDPDDASHDFAVSTADPADSLSVERSDDTVLDSAPAAETRPDPLTDPILPDVAAELPESPAPPIATEPVPSTDTPEASSPASEAEPPAAPEPDAAPRAPRARATPRRAKDPAAPRTGASTAARRAAKAVAVTTDGADAAADAASTEGVGGTESPRPRAPRTRQPSTRTRTTAAKKTTEPGVPAADDAAPVAPETTEGDSVGAPSTGNAAVEVSPPVRNRRTPAARTSSSSEGGSGTRSTGTAPRRTTGTRATKSTATGSGSRPAKAAGSGTRSTTTRSRSRAATASADVAASGTEELRDLDVAAPESVGLPRVVPRELPEPPPAGDTPPMVDAVVAAALDELRAAARRPRHATRTVTSAPEPDEPAADLLPEEPRDFVHTAPAETEDPQVAIAARAFEAASAPEPAEEPAELPAPPATPLTVVPPLAYRFDSADDSHTVSFPAVPEDVPSDPVEESGPREHAGLHAVPPLVARPETEEEPDVEPAALVEEPLAEPEPEPGPSLDEPTSGHPLPDLSDLAESTTVLPRIEAEPEPEPEPETEPASASTAVLPERIDLPDLPEPEPEVAEPIEPAAALVETPASPEFEAPEFGTAAPPLTELPRPAAARAPRTRPQPARPAAGRAPRRARLTVRTVNPWSVFKVAAVVSLILVIIGVIATVILYITLDSAGVFGSLAKAIDNLNDSGPGTANPSARKDFSALIVIGGSTAILLVNAILATIFATIGAFVYNLCASFVGGIELTLTERS